MEKKPWENYLRPNAKTERMKYFNDVTKEIYESAFTHKQSQFLSYLNGQRQFRWDTKKRIEKLQHVTKSYQEGFLPKENIFVDRYHTMPDDATLKDVSFVNRAASHIRATREAIEELLEKLQKRKVELFDHHMELKKWAKNENQFVSKCIEEAGELGVQVSKIEDNVSNTAKQLNKRYAGVDVSNFEMKRKRRREKEQKCKNRKKSKMTLLRNTQTLLKNSGYTEDEVEEICPSIYGKKASRVISSESLSKADHKSISDLTIIGALSDLLSDDVMSDINVTDSSDSASSEDDL